MKLKIKNLQTKIKTHIRTKALLRTKARLAEKGIDINDLTKEELETIIKDEEDRLIGEYKNKTIMALLVALGIGSF
ncbi:MAG: hypothetical protein ABGX26_01580 [Nautiliaceae bacterium]|jgi:Glu-tRNA(Gln) amidotransferase subunit E-like FAD-binding protein